MAEEEQIELTEAEIALAEAPMGEDAQVEEASADELEENVDEGSDEEIVEDSEQEEEIEEEEEEPESSESVDTGDIGLSEEDYTLGQSYGLSREEVDDLGSRELLEKFGRISSRQAMEAKPKEAEPEPESESTEDESQEVATLDLSKVDLDEYDDVTKSAFQAIDQLQKKIAGLEKQNKQLEQTQNSGAIQEFNTKLDNLDPEFFGSQGQGAKPADMSKDQMDRRMKLAETIDMISAGYTSQGKQVPSLDVLIRDANAIAFREREEQKRKTTSQKRLKKQSARRQSSGSRVKKQASVREPVDSEEAEIQRILAETDEAYQRMLEEN